MKSFIALAAVGFSYADIRTRISGFACEKNCCGDHDVCNSTYVVSYSELQQCRSVVSTSCIMTGEGTITRGNNTEIACIDSKFPSAFGLAYADMDMSLGIPTNFKITGLNATGCIGGDWNITADGVSDGTLCAVKSETSSDLHYNSSLRFTPAINGYMKTFNVSVSASNTQGLTMGAPAQVVRFTGGSCDITLDDPVTDMTTETWLILRTTGRVAPSVPNSAFAWLGAALIGTSTAVWALF